MADTNINKTFVICDIISSVRYGLAFFMIIEITGWFCCIY